MKKQITATLKLPIGTMKTITLSDGLHAALLYFLNYLVDIQSITSCNDSPEELLNLFDPKEQPELLKKADLINFNGQPAPKGQESHWPLMDFQLLSIIKNEVKNASIMSPADVEKLKAYETFADKFDIAARVALHSERAKKLINALLSYQSSLWGTEESSDEYDERTARSFARFVKTVNEI
jgi:hypothetical protein